MSLGAAPKRVLDLSKRNPIMDPLLKKLSTRLIGQPQAAQTLVDMCATHLSGFGNPGRPAGSALFLGPTGSGKTHAVEMLCEGLVGDTRACLKVDCAEFQHSHEIAKLIGSPPGYLGHRETHPLLTQEALNQWWKNGMQLSVLLFDEIEKASDSLWQLLLGILDKSRLTLGDNRVVNFDNVIIVLTSNLGAKELHAKPFGFGNESTVEEINDKENSVLAREAAKKHFTPEFINRLDHIDVFNTLTREDIKKVMMLELGLIQQQMLDKGRIVYQLTDSAKEKIMEEGYSVEYGARMLKRTIERRVRLPLVRLISAAQAAPGDYLVIDQVNPSDENFEFSVQKLRHTNVTFKDHEENIA